jgi:hypothetical protein
MVCCRFAARKGAMKGLDEFFALCVLGTHFRRGCVVFLLSQASPSIYNWQFFMQSAALFKFFVLVCLAPSRAVKHIRFAPIQKASRLQHLPSGCAHMLEVCQQSHRCWDISELFDWARQSAGECWVFPCMRRCIRYDIMLGMKLLYFHLCLPFSTPFNLQLIAIMFWLSLVV